MNKDGITNNNGNKLIKLCKMSDLKIANGRIGKDMGIGTIHAIPQMVIVPSICVSSYGTVSLC